MTKTEAAPDVWSAETCRSLIDTLWPLRQAMLDYEAALAPMIRELTPGFWHSARNLAHYLVLRQHDRRGLQEALAALGLSSLGRAESHVLANLDKVLGILHRLSGQDWYARSEEEPVGIKSSRRLADAHARDLLGPLPPERAVRIMVTLPSAAASDYGLVRRLVHSGMDIARINCAHDTASEWEAMAGHVRRAAKAERRAVRILMDLGGPKLRTGPLPRTAAVLRLRPQRDNLGRVIAPARIGLRAPGQSLPISGAEHHLAVDARWLARLREGDELRLSDAREARRRWRIVAIEAHGALAEAPQTAYVTETTRLIRAGKGGPKSTVIGEIPPRELTLNLRLGDHLRLTRSGSGRADARRRAMPSVECTLSEVFSQVAVGERIWFDDGRIGGVIRRVHADELEVEVTQARAQGETLASDKGINLPDSALRLPALTDKDIEDLRHAARLADMVGLSFVQEAADVDTLRELLQSLQAPQLGIVLKIETRRGFEHLPAILFAAMRAQAAGIMIARGDLAVECGYERLAEVQEEILWAAEAAHLPVIWATQVLESLAKTGLPSRAEITDAAMGERAECVMLNKGPHIDDAILLLDDILRRMQSHQSKKRSLLRALHAWELPQA